MPKRTKPAMKCFYFLQNGILSSLGYIPFVVFSLVAACISDFLRKRHILQTVNVRRAMQSVGKSQQHLFQPGY